MPAPADRTAGGGVLLVTSFGIPHAGGASTHVEMLASALRARGLLHGLVTPLAGAYRRHPRWLLERLVRPDAAQAWAIGATRGALERELRCRVAARVPAVVHAHDPLAACAAAGALGGLAAIVQTVHGPWSREHATMHGRPRPRSQAVMEAIEREAFAAADLVVAVDRGQAELVVRDFSVDPVRVVVVPNAVDVDALPAASQPAAEAFLLVPRRLVPKNGVEVALRAFARARAGAARLVVAGDGPLRASLEALARELGVARRVVFLGDVERPRLLALMSGAAAVLVPSVPVNGVIEATSLAVLEAMASRVPVIGSCVGGIAEIMQDGCGALVPPGDAHALAGAVERTLEMPAPARARLVEHARARVREAYGMDRWMRRMEDAYGLAAGRRSARVHG